MKNLRIYVVTLFANSALGFVLFFGMVIISAISFRNNLELWSTAATADPTPLLAFLLFWLAACILVNFFCFRYCKRHKAGGVGTYVISACAVIVGIALPFIIWQSVI